MSILPVCMFVYYVHAVPTEARSGHQVGPLELELDGCELLCGCWKLNPSPLEKQSVVLTTELSSAQLRIFLSRLLKIHRLGRVNMFLLAERRNY